MEEPKENSFEDQLRQIVLTRFKDPRFGVEALAGEIPMHRSSLSRKLKQLTGKKPSQLIVQIRMEEARNLLLGTQLPVSRIALSVGFDELSNFTRAFKRHFGDTPSNVRNKGSKE